MNISARVKVLIVLAGIFALAVWVVLMDLGLNAGRIHYGVNVRGVDVGGRTYDEAVDILRRAGKRRQKGPVVFSAEGMECSFKPKHVGWRPEPKVTAERAREVGFEGGVVNALGDRVRGYFAGVEIDWAGTANPDKVSDLIDDCEQQAVALGLELDRDELRRRMERAIGTWPRGIFQVPVRR